MPVIPTAANALAIYKLRRMIGKSAAWQNQSGFANAEQARKAVRIKDFDFEDNRPNACISETDFGWQTIAGGGQLFLRPSGSLFLYLAVDTPKQYAHDEQESFLFVSDFFGNVIEDIADVSELDQTTDTDVSDSELNIHTITLIGIEETPRENWNAVGRFWHTGYQLEWGTS